MEGVSPRASGRVWLQLVLRALPGLQDPVATDDAAKARRRERVFIISAPEIPNSISAVSSISDLDFGGGGVAREGWAGVRERPGITAIEALGALSRRQPLVECMTAYFHT